MSGSGCPDWCTESECRGEHQAQVGDGYIPALGGLGRGSVYGRGIVFPSIGVALSHNTIDDLRASVSIHISSELEDAQADLHANELKILIRELVVALEVLEGRACVNEVNSLFGMPL